VTQGFSGADLANVLNEAALLAGRRRQSEVSRAVLEEAVERVLLGLASRRQIMGEEERRATAYHEAGHALVGLSLPGVTVPAKVSIVPRGRALGFVLQSDHDEYGTLSRSKLINQMAMGLAGRVAEQLVTGEPNSGASSDLAKVSRIARRMICEYGMSEALGGVAFPDERRADFSGLPGFSEEIMRQIDLEVRRLVDEAHEQARQVVAGSQEVLGRIAEALLERETLSAEELEALVGRAPVPSGVGAGPTRPPHARVPTSAP
jgi:cell division protease FtsH